MKYITIIIPILLLLSCSFENQTADKLSEAPDTPAILTANTVALSDEQIRLADIETGLLQQQVVSDFVECSGKLALPPQHILTITPPIEGFVEKVNYLPGDFVRKGALLAVLSHPEYISMQQDYLQTQSQLTFAKQEYQRQKELSEGNAAARKNLEKTTAGYESLKAQLMGIAARLQYIGIQPENISQNGIKSSIAIYAPANVFVTEVNINPGKYVNEQTELYELIDKSHIHLDLNVFEKDIARIDQGQQVYFRLNENANRLYEGKVMLVGQKLESENQAFSVHVEPDDVQDFFKPGMFAQAKIFMNADSVAVVPETAIIRSGKHKYLFIQEGGEFVRKEITTGASVEDLVEVKNPESLSGKQIVLKGAYYLEAELEE